AMQSIVCQVQEEKDGLSLTWSQGKDSFNPYHLGKVAAAKVAKLAAEARKALADVVERSLDAARQGGGSPGTELPQASLALARAGYQLFRALLDPGQADRAHAAIARDVRKWLKDSQKRPGVARLEIVLKGELSCSIPWNVVYDAEPDEKAFLSGGGAGEHWRPFWGVRYDLTGGPPVTPLARVPWGKPPPAWMGGDPETHRG